jgi:teichuronic acid biosynthesis glycosyltransferase TuaC
MKLLMIHVGNPVRGVPVLPNEHYFKRYSFEYDSEQTYLKKDIVNADSQMQSLIQLNIAVSYGYLGSRKNPITLFRTGKLIRRKIKEERIDIVHVLWGSTAALMTVLFSPVPVVVSFCGSDLMGNYNSKGDKTFSGLITRTLSIYSSYFAKRIIVKSELLLKNLPFHVRHKCTVIPNGIDINLFYTVNKKVARERLNWNQNEKIILFFTGSGAFVKNRKLAEDVYHLTKNEIENSRIVFLEGVVFEKLILYYNAADLLLLTSYHEGSNNSLKEAMACNLPIISTNCGDAKERLRDVKNSFVSDSYDEVEISLEAIKILNSSVRSNGRDFINSFTKEIVAMQVYDVYKLIYPGL